MKRLLLAFVLLPSVALAAPTVETLPGCPAGWRDAQTKGLPTTTPVATQSYSAPDGAGLNAIWVQTDIGNVLAMLDGGQSVKFVCFAADPNN